MRRFLLTCLVLLGIAPALFAEPIKLTFATDWKAQAEHGGFYEALARGYYADAGLDVRIRPGGPQIDIPRLMAAGALDIGMASNNFQPLNLLRAGARVKAVMAAFQKDPQVLMVHGDHPAMGLADLVGQPVFISDSAATTWWPWLRARFGYTDTQIRKYTYSLAPWLVNRNTVQEGYVTSEPYTARKAGADPKVFLLADAGYPGYSAMVMARSAFIADHPDVVRSFVSASIKGWQDFVWSKEPRATALILADNPDMTQALIDHARREFKERTMLGDVASVGQMSDARWQSFYATMVELGVLPEGLDVSEAYTLDFLPQP